MPPLSRVRVSSVVLPPSPPGTDMQQPYSEIDKKSRLKFTTNSREYICDTFKSELPSRLSLESFTCKL